MSTKRLTLGTALLLFLGTAPLAMAQTEEVAAFEADRRAAFSRIDEVLPWDTSALPFVIERQKTVDGGRPWETLRRIGFIVHDAGSSVTVRLVDGSVVHLDAYGKREPDLLSPLLVESTRQQEIDPHQVFEPADMAAVASHIVVVLADRTKGRILARPDGSFEIEEVALLLARHASRHGLDDVANSLCSAVLSHARRSDYRPRRMGDTRSETREQPEESFEDQADIAAPDGVNKYWPEATLLRLLDETLESLANWRDTMDYEDPSLSWSDVLERQRRFVAHFPKSPRAPHHRDRFAALETRIEEESARRATNRPMSFAPNLSTADLAWLLRDDFDGRVSDELVRRGLEAVPHLLPLLNDWLPSRRASIPMQRWFASVHGELSIASLALEICNRISGHVVPSRASIDEAAENRRRWFADVTARGEESVLLDGVRAYENHSAACAERLVSRYPKTAAEVVRLARHCPSESIRTNLISSLRNCRDPEALEALAVELDTAERFTHQIVAQILCARGHSRGIDYLLGKLGQEAESGFDMVSSDLGFDTYALLESGAPRAIAAVAEALRSKGVARRFAAIEGIRLFVIDHIRDGHPMPSEIEIGLFGCLNDLEPHRPLFWFGWHQPSSGRVETLGAPSVAEFAASTLNWISEERYPFDVMAPRRARRAAIDAMRDRSAATTGNEASATTLESQEPSEVPTDHVATVTIAPASDADDVAGRRLLEMRGKTIDINGIISVFETAVREAPTSTSKILLTIDRLSRGQGIAITLERYEAPRRRSSDGLFDWHISLLLDGRILQSGNGGSTSFALDSVREFGDKIADDLRHLIATPDAPPFEVFVLATY